MQRATQERRLQRGDPLGLRVKAAGGGEGVGKRKEVEETQRNGQRLLQITVDDSLAVDWTALQREVALKNGCYLDRQECNKM